MEGIVEFARQRDLSLELGTYMFPPARRDRTHLREYSRFTPEDAARYTLQYHQLTKPPDQYRRFLEQAASGFTPPPARARPARCIS
ncbi:MAG: hypothetical protein LUH09_03020 [Clostridiales bacterium]|nr:hypothetical protein [Clostridiales bacterium]